MFLPQPGILANATLLARYLTFSIVMRKELTLVMVALSGFTRPVTGARFRCLPIAQDKLDLSAPGN